MEPRQVVIFLLAMVLGVLIYFAFPRELIRKYLFDEEKQYEGSIESFVVCDKALNKQEINAFLYGYNGIYYTRIKVDSKGNVKCSCENGGNHDSE